MIYLEYAIAECWFIIVGVAGLFGLIGWAIGHYTSINPRGH